MSFEFWERRHYFFCFSSKDIFGTGTLDSMTFDINDIEYSYLNIASKVEYDLSEIFSVT